MSYPLKNSSIKKSLNNIKCKIWIHNWEYFDTSNLENFNRGCLRCGKVQVLALSLGFHDWHDWAKGWTYPKVKEFLKKQQSRELKRKQNDEWMMKLKYGTDSEKIEAQNYFMKLSFEKKDDPNISVGYHFKP